MAKKRSKVDDQVEVKEHNASLDLLKAKLRKKFNLLKDDPLDFDDLEPMKVHICAVMGIDRPKFDWLIQDL